MSEIDYAARVAKGAALLDEQHPGWVDEIDLDALEIQNTSHCVTAQLSGTGWYIDGADQLGLDLGNEGSYVAHGFDTETVEADNVPEGCEPTGAYHALNRLWREVITTRREARS